MSGAGKFSNFLIQIATALREEKGPELAFLLKPTSEHGKQLVKEMRNPTRESLAYYEGSMESPWDEIAIHYVLVVNHCAKKREAEAFKEECTLVNLFLRYFAMNSGWTLPALFSILRDLRDLAFDVRQEGTASMEEAARIISKAFSSCVTDRQSPYAESRKWGVYYVVGLILKCYFRVKRISLSKSILRAIDANPDIPPLTEYPRSHQAWISPLFCSAVTYRYYIGMLSFLNEDFAKAEQELTLAFYNCDIKAHSNQERILTYLLPLRLLRGHLPTRELLDRFPVLDELFSPFISAVQTGDIGGYDAALDKSERRLVDLNLYLTLERARELCIRGLFRRVWIASQKGTRIPVSLFHTSLKIAGMDVSQEEAECYAANMIYKGFMRGYISHEKQMVVLASANAFPRLADRASPYASLY
ncbi:COP9 signalosome complex subunit 12 [Laetiporus sulphureus 93-53]|uniref:COP9 signalosome complex subunit 12 n=1 Tax=Laetiporus sulphureus 93-53 TaxID=1314785 RepID=A0A165DSU5_9APHY|nr:COP9 signalosome complex subunit 12 [Laetiporus sulphureus 93-53]KZT05561.1 COP9 signalosome complex subunit 12 [Laetiporus sulphureus 93-53]